MPAMPFLSGGIAKRINLRPWTDGLNFFYRPGRSESPIIKRSSGAVLKNTNSLRGGIGPGQRTPFWPPGVPSARSIATPIGTR